MQKLKIAVLVSNPCVIDARVMRMSEKEALLGYEVKVFATFKDGNKQNEIKNGVAYERSIWNLSEYCRRYIPRFVRIKKIKGFFVKRLAKYLKYFSFSETFYTNIIEYSPDIIHSHDLVCLPLGVRLKKSLNAKLIYDAHELEIHRNPPLPFIEKAYTYYIEQKYAQHADCIITVNGSIANILKSKFRKEVYTIRNAPMLHSYHGETLREKVALSHKEKILLYVGKLSSNRGLEWVVEQLKELPNIHFVCVGHQDKNTLKSLKVLAKEHDVENRFHVVEPVPHDEVVDFIKGADLGICAINPVTKSYYYSLPNKVFEMSIAGLPIIATNLPEIRSFLDTIGNGYYFDYNNPKKIPFLVKEVLKDLDNGKLKHNEISKIAKNYSWENESQKLKEILDAITDK